MMIDAIFVTICTYGSDTTINKQKINFSRNGVLPDEATNQMSIYELHFEMGYNIEHVPVSFLRVWY